jgi:hypothetical protein
VLGERMLQPWFFKKFEKDFDGTFFKSAGSTD